MFKDIKQVMKDSVLYGIGNVQTHRRYGELPQAV